MELQYYYYNTTIQGIQDLFIIKDNVMKFFLLVFSNNISYYFIYFFYFLH